MWTSKGVNSPSKTIITVNYDTFTVKGSITINSNLISGLGYVSYDNATNKMYAGTNSYLFEIDPESGAIKSTTPITDSPQITKVNIMDSLVAYTTVNFIKCIPLLKC